jgi:hypothetical protein
MVGVLVAVAVGVAVGTVGVSVGPSPMIGKKTSPDGVDWASCAATVGGNVPAGYGPLVALGSGG